MGDFINNINWEFVIAIAAIAISLYSIYLQRRHNILAYKPIPVVVKYNYSSHVSVKIWNKGTGPLIITSVEIGKLNNLVDALPEHTKKLKFVEYINKFDSRAITPNDHLNMLEFKIRLDESGKPKEEYVSALQDIKNELHGKEIRIGYKDIFENTDVHTSPALNFLDSKDEIGE